MYLSVIEKRKKKKNGVDERGKAREISGFSDPTNLSRT
jgi:hypothetical protein